MVHRHSPLTVVLVVLALLIAACGGAAEEPSAGDKTGDTAGEGEDLTPASLTLNWVPYGEHAPFYYGKDLGCFSDEGIDLTIQPGNGSGKTVQATGTGRTDFGWADTPALILGADGGIPVQSLGVYLQKGPAAIEFLADAGIQAPEDLKGKTVGGTPGDAMFESFPAWLQINGMSTDDVEIVNVDPAGKVAALAAGQVDSIMGFFHDQGPTIEEQTGKEVDALLYADHGMNLLGTGLIANTEMVSGDPELAAAMARGSQCAWEAAVEDPEAAAASMSEQVPHAHPEPVLLQQLELTLDLLHTERTDGEAPGVNAEEDWQETIGLLAEHVGLDNAGDPATYWVSDVTGGE